MAMSNTSRHTLKSEQLTQAPDDLNQNLELLECTLSGDVQSSSARMGVCVMHKKKEGPTRDVGGIVPADPSKVLAKELGNSTALYRSTGPPTIGGRIPKVRCHPSTSCPVIPHEQ